MNYRERIRGVREDRDLTQAHLGKILNKSQQGYSHIESGRAELKIDDLILLCKYYDLSADYLSVWLIVQYHIRKDKLFRYLDVQICIKVKNESINAWTVSHLLTWPFELWVVPHCWVVGWICILEANCQQTTVDARRGLSKVVTKNPKSCRF